MAEDSETKNTEAAPKRTPSPKRTPLLAQLREFLRTQKRPILKGDKGLFDYLNDAADDFTPTARKR